MGYYISVNSLRSDKYVGARRWLTAPINTRRTSGTGSANKASTATKRRCLYSLRVTPVAGDDGWVQQQRTEDPRCQGSYRTPVAKETTGSPLPMKLQDPRCQVSYRTAGAKETTGSPLPMKLQDPRCRGSYRTPVAKEATGPPLPRKLQTEERPIQVQQHVPVVPHLVTKRKNRQLCLPV
ncbi:hypothetical protein LSAT2_016995, partial [Lamellibrachia satsuma]